MREPVSLLDIILWLVVLLKHFSWLEIHHWCETGRCRDPEGTTRGSGRDVKALHMGLLWGCTSTHLGPKQKRANSSHKARFPPKSTTLLQWTPVFFYQNHSQHNNIKKDVLTLTELRWNFQVLVVNETLPARKAQLSPDTHTAQENVSSFSRSNRILCCSFFTSLVRELHNS